MRLHFVALLISTLFFISSCATQQIGKSVQSYGWDKIQLNPTTKENQNIALRVAFIGDLEPKPCALFPNLEAAVAHLNQLNETQPIDFVLGVGDVAHKGTEIQYETATEVFANLKPAFYPIMGNEEHGNTVDFYMEFARQWNPQIKSPNTILDLPQLAFVLASPDFSRDFNDRGARKVAAQIKQLAPKPVILVVHGAQQGVYTENADKGISNPTFINEVVTQPNLAAVFSGDLHMDLERSQHSKKLGNVHYMHIPALERTKIPDDTVHNPMIRILSIDQQGNAVVETFHTGNFQPIDQLTYRFPLELH